MAVVAAYTAFANLMPAVGLIEMGVRGDRLFQGVSWVKHYPEMTYAFKPIFHYSREASKAARLGARVGGKVGARVGGRLIPGVGWALLAYDVYDIAFNHSLWGFDLS